MLNYIIRRVLQTIPIMLGVAFIVLILFTKVGEDPVRMKLGNHATAEAIQDLRAKWDLDKPLGTQYLLFLKQIVTFDYGESFNSGEKLSEMFANGAEASLMLTVPPFSRPPLSTSANVREESSTTEPPPPVKLTVPPAVMVGATCSVSSVLVASGLETVPSFTTQLMVRMVSPPTVGSPSVGSNP